MQAVKQRLSTSGYWSLLEDKQKTTKIFQKTFEKPLDKRKEMWYNSQAVRETASERSSHRSLTIEQQEIKVQAKLVIENLEISLKKKSWIYHGFKTYSKSKKSQTSSTNKVLTGNGLNTICSRVWSWLRMNAGGVHNTFKSNEVAIPSGGRVSNAWATCPCVGDTVWKRTLIPHNVTESHGSVTKDLLRKDGLALD